MCKVCNSIRRIENLVLKCIIYVYLYIFARRCFDKLNRFMFNISLRGMGYNNCCSPEITGELFLIRNYLAKLDPKYCIDVGANVGEYSKMIMKYTNSNIISFEPLRESFKHLQTNLSEYSNRVVLENLGLGDVNCELELNYDNKNTELASFCSEIANIDYIDSDSIARRVCKVVTLDDYLSNHNINHNIDFIKVDTEGFEYEVILGAQNTIKRYKPKVIAIEFNIHHMLRNHSLHHIGKLLDQYVVYQLLPLNGGLIRRSLQSINANIYAYSNFIFVRKDIEMELISI